MAAFYVILENCTQNVLEKSSSNYWNFNKEYFKHW